MPRSLLLSLIAAICLAGTPACSKDDPAAAPPTPTLIAETPAPAQPTATPAPTLGEADLIVPAWREVSEAELPTAPYQSVLLDVASGRFYMAGATPKPQHHDGGVAIVGWLPSGDAVLESRISINEGRFEAVGALYVAAPLGDFRRLTNLYRMDSGRPSHAISSTGLIAWNAGPENLLLDPQMGQVVARLPAPPHEIFAWSADGNLLAMQGDDHGTGKSVLVWDRRDGTIHQIDEARPAAWSNRGNKLAYTLIEGDPLHAVRVRDFESSADTPVSLARGVFGWSPDDRYLALRAEGLYKTTIFDLQTGRSMTITASTDGGWVDADTYFFLGETCEEETLYTVQADGSGLRAVAPLEWVFAEPRLAPDGDTIAFNGLPHDERWSVKLASIAQGRVIREFGVGGTALRDNWSPDSRYVVVEAPFGRDACMDPPPPMKTEIRVG